jgi:hypothetical protein
MTTIAYHQYANITTGGYSSSPISGPLSHQEPGQIPYHKNKSLVGYHQNPPQFQVCDGTSDFSNARSQYARTKTTENNMNVGIHEHSDVGPTRVFNAETQRSYLLAQSTKYNSPKCSSLYISARKSAAIGKSSFKQTMPNSVPISYASSNANDPRHALRMIRGSGCVAPAKKGSIFNYSLGNRSFNIGNIPRSTY